MPTLSGPTAQILPAFARQGSRFGPHRAPRNRHKLFFGGFFRRFWGFFAVQHMTHNKTSAVPIHRKIAHFRVVFTQHTTWRKKKGGHPARPYYQASTACGGYDIRQTEAKNTLFQQAYISSVGCSTVLGKIPRAAGPGALSVLLTLLTSLTQRQARPKQ